MVLEWSREEQLRHASTKSYWLARRAGKHHLPSNVSAERWLAILTTWGERCAYCGRSADTVGAPLTADHFIPLHDPACLGSVAWNIVPACGRCNWNKDGHCPFTWLAERFGQAKGEQIARRVLLALAQARYWYYQDRAERRRQRKVVLQS